jgi:hypothetical protein
MASTSSGLPKILDAIGGERGHFPRLPVGKFYLPPKGDPLEHPRNDEPVDDELVASIVAHGFWEDEPVIIWQKTAKGGEVTLDGTVLKYGQALLVIGPGSRRSKAGFKAQGIFRKKGTLGKNEAFLVPSRLFNGTEAEFHRLRQHEDSKLLKKRHKPSQVAHNLIAAKNAGSSTEDCVACKPSDYEACTAVALFGWRSLPPAVAALLDAGQVELDEEGRDAEPGKGTVFDVNINVLSALVEHVPDADMLVALKELAFRRRKRANTAARDLRARGQRVREAQETQGASELSAAAAPAATASSSVASASPQASDGVAAASQAKPAATKAAPGATPKATADGAAKGKTKSAAAAPAVAGDAPAPPLASPVEAVSAKLVRKGANQVREAARSTNAAKAFFFCAELGLRDRATAEKFVEEMLGTIENPVALHAFAGLLWSAGVFSATVQGVVDPDVLRIVSDLRSSKNGSTQRKRGANKALKAATEGG